MAWHVASRTAIPTSCLSEPLAKPLDLEYAANAHRREWWQPQQRLAQLSWPTSTSTSPRQLPPIPQAVTPRYATHVYSPTLREHIFTVRAFDPEPRRLAAPEGRLLGSPPLTPMLSTPRLARERGLKIPHTPIYDGTVYDNTWHASSTGYFGPSH